MVQGISWGRRSVLGCQPIGEALVQQTAFVFISARRYLYFSIIDSLLRMKSGAVHETGQYGRICQSIRAEAAPPVEEST